jgi:alpha-tubulin suppressor-like RCC1 family protein
MWCWGRNVEGQLGTGDTSDRPSPVQVGHDVDWVQVSTGRFHTCALRADGSIWCTGANDDGRLGTGDLDRRDVMTRVVIPNANSD